MTAAGAAMQITSAYAYGEGIEMRYQVTDWTGVGSSFKGMYLRAEAMTTAASGKSVYGAEIYGVCNNVTMTTGSLWGTLTYAYVKGVAAVTVNNMYAVQGELTWDASRTHDCTITTAAACFRAKITGGRVADYTKIHGYELTIGEMDGDSSKFGSGIFMQDDSGMAGTCTLTTGVNILIGCTTGISIAGATTDALSISGDATTAINITSGCTPTDGLKIAGACANAINITGVATTKAIVMTSQTGGLLQGTTTMTLSSAHRNAFEINAISSANAAYELRGLYVTAYPSTTAQATSKMRGVYSEVKSALNIDNMVAVYGYANMSAAKTIATGSAALHGDVNVDNATTLSAGRMAALWAQVRGDSTLTGNLDCVYVDAEMDVDNAIYINIDSAKTATTGISLAGSGTYTTAIDITGTLGAKGINISSACTSAQLYIGGSAILASGEQAIYVNCAEETTATNGVWVTLKSTVASGDLTGGRFISESLRETSGGPNVRAVYGQARCKTASKYAALLQGGLFVADYNGGSATVTDMYGVTGFISQGSGLTTSGNVAAVQAHLQTRSDESIGVHCGILVHNEAVGGNGLCLAQGAIYITESSLGGSVKGYECVVDASTATLTDQGSNKVTIMKFKDQAGNAKTLSYTVGAAALAVA
jgi:hypothetical protein